MSVFFRGSTVLCYQSSSSSAILFAVSSPSLKNGVHRSRSLLLLAKAHLVTVMKYLWTRCSDALNSWCCISGLFTCWHPGCSWHNVHWGMDNWNHQKQPRTVSLFNSLQKFFISKWVRKFGEAQFNQIPVVTMRRGLNTQTNKSLSITNCLQPMSGVIVIRFYEFPSIVLQCTGLSMSQTLKYPLALTYHLLWTPSEDVSIRPHSSAHTGDSSTQCPTLPSQSSIRSFTWWWLETSSWSPLRSLDRPTPQQHWICSCQHLETSHSTGPWWSDATARADYVMTTTMTCCNVQLEYSSFAAKNS